MLRRATVDWVGVGLPEKTWQLVRICRCKSPGRKTQLARHLQHHLCELRILSHSYWQHIRCLVARDEADPISISKRANRSPCANDFLLDRTVKHVAAPFHRTFQRFERRAHQVESLIHRRHTIVNNNNDSIRKQVTCRDDYKKRETSRFRRIYSPRRERHSAVRCWP